MYSITKTESQELLSRKNETPPPTSKNFLTQDGIELLNECEYEYDIFFRELEAYFNGDASILNNPNIEPELQEYFDLKKKWFLSLYELIRTSWKYLTPYHKDRHGNNLTPGLLTSELLRVECMCKLLPLKGGYVEKNRRKNYKLRSEIPKAKRTGNSDLLLKKVRKYLGEQDNYISLLPAVLTYCRSGEKDILVAKALNNYLLDAEEYTSYGEKINDFRNGHNEVWNRGSKRS